MQIEPTSLPGVLILTPIRHIDDRGWFSETWNAARMAAAGLRVDFVQDNRSFCHSKGTLRGLHCQIPPKAQDKLVFCTRGAVLDVAVDIRTGSPTYGRWVAVELSAETGLQIYLPKGFLHGFVTLTDGAEVQYKCSNPYSPDHDCAVRWDDPAIGIDWGVTRPILSPKDASAPLLAEIGQPFLWEGA